MARQLKFLIEKYPKIMEEVSEEVRLLLTSGDFLKELIES